MSRYFHPLGFVKLNLSIIAADVNQNHFYFRLKFCIRNSVHTGSRVFLREWKLVEQFQSHTKLARCIFPQVPKQQHFCNMSCSISGASIYFDGSFPLNAHPPCGCCSPYVSTIIFLPVKPVSPCGPPISNRPVGLTKYFVLHQVNFSE